MKISRLWLQKFFDSELPPADKLADALTFHAFEIDGVEKVDTDDVLDVKVTPNRGHDCLSHRGVAKELAAILNLPLTHDPLALQPTLTPVTKDVQVFVAETTLCPRYVAGVIKGVKVGPSPEWLKKSLEAVGQRSINNVVDATNFVMLNIGQPLHAFDAGKLMSRDGVYAISVRRARSGEKLRALDQKDYLLADSMLVIVDANADAAIGIAGVKGGEPAGITNQTTDIIVESANFNSVSVRKTAQGLKLRTDASARFEQNISPELAGYGMRAVVDLIVELAGGKCTGFVDVYTGATLPMLVRVSVDQVNAVLGTAVTAAEVADVFTRLGLAYKEEAGVFEVQPPFERLDLVLPEDLVEEVGRIVGYDAVPAVALPAFPTKPEVNANFYAAEHTREELLAQGYSEVLTPVFASEGERAVLNKVDSGEPFLRASLISGLTAALEKNKQSKDLLGLKEVKLFEIGVVWKGGGEELVVATVGENEKPQEHALAVVTAVDYEPLPLSTVTRYQPFSRYPYIVRDIAMWTPAGTNEDEVQKMIEQEAGELAHKVWLFDRFEKEGRVSLAYRLIFQSFERTLTEEEVNKVMEKVSAALKAKGFEIR